MSDDLMREAAELSARRAAAREAKERAVREQEAASAAERARRQEELDRPKYPHLEEDIPRQLAEIGSFVDAYLRSCGLSPDTLWNKKLTSTTVRDPVSYEFGFGSPTFKPDSRAGEGWLLLGAAIGPDGSWWSESVRTYESDWYRMKPKAIVKQLSSRGEAMLGKLIVRLIDAVDGARLEVHDPRRVREEGEGRRLQDVVVEAAVVRAEQYNSMR